MTLPMRTQNLDDVPEAAHAAEQKISDKWTKQIETDRAALEAELRAQVSSLTADAHRLLIEDASRRIAREIARAGADSVILPHIKARLAVETRDNVRRVVVLDTEGRPSSLTIDGLTGQFKTDATFAPLLRDFQGEAQEHQRKVMESLGLGAKAK